MHRPLLNDAIVRRFQNAPRYEPISIRFIFLEEPIADSRYQHVRAALTNMLIDPSHVALQRNLKERGIPLFGFQHGVTSEIAARQARNVYIQENTWCDTALTFNGNVGLLQGKRT